MKSDKALYGYFDCFDPDTNTLKYQINFVASLDFYSGPGHVVSETRANPETN